MYRPGEEVHIKGWVRTIGAGPTGDVTLDRMAAPRSITRSWTRRGNQIASGSADMSELGGFDVALRCLRTATWAMPACNSRTQHGDLWPYYHGFQIQEFRRPEFEETARNETTPTTWAMTPSSPSRHSIMPAALPGAEVTT